jgi:sugar phosphate isomerase/epimerase
MLESPAGGLSRRSFLRLGLLGAATLPAACSAPPPPPEPKRLPFRISLAQWSLHRHFQGRVEPALDPADFARIAREYGIDAIEYVNQFYRQRAGEPAFWRDLRRRAGDAGVRSLLIMCDGLGEVGDPDPAGRRRTVENHLPMLEAAQVLGCHSIRVNAQSRGDRDEQERLAADGLRMLCERADAYGVDVLVENHGGWSSDGTWLAAVIRRTAHRRAGTLPDFGNFRVAANQHYDRYLGVAELLPFARAVSAKSYDFDAAGDETTIDYGRMLRLVVGAGYSGHVGIEYEGNRLPEPDGIRATKALLERLQVELAG